MQPRREAIEPKELLGLVRIRQISPAQQLLSLLVRSPRHVHRHPMLLLQPMCKSDVIRMNVRHQDRTQRHATERFIGYRLPCDLADIACHSGIDNHATVGTPEQPHIDMVEIDGQWNAGPEHPGRECDRCAGLRYHVDVLQALWSGRPRLTFRSHASGGDIFLFGSGLRCVWSIDSHP